MCLRLFFHREVSIKQSQLRLCLKNKPYDSWLLQLFLQQLQGPFLAKYNHTVIWAYFLLFLLPQTIMTMSLFEHLRKSKPFASCSTPCFCNKVSKLEAKLAYYLLLLEIKLEFFCTGVYWSLLLFSYFLFSCLSQNLKSFCLKAMLPLYQGDTLQQRTPLNFGT